MLLAALWFGKDHKPIRLDGNTSLLENMVAINLHTANNAPSTAFTFAF